MEKGDEKKKLETHKMYQPSRDEYAALHYLAIALRPEWKNHPPGQIWQRETQDRTFPHAENFEHCIAAITDYCQASKNGEPVYKFPTLFPAEGDHWKTTVPRTLEKNPREPCPDHPLDRANKWSCISCRSEILAGDRPADKQGIALAPKGPAIPAPRDQHDAAQTNTHERNPKLSGAILGASEFNQEQQP